MPARLGAIAATAAAWMMRVSAVEEIEGLDLHEIGVLAYNGDSLSSNPEAAPEAVASGAVAPVLATK